MKKLFLLVILCFCNISNALQDEYWVQFDGHSMPHRILYFECITVDQVHCFHDNKSIDPIQYAAIVFREPELKILDIVIDKTNLSLHIYCIKENK